MGIPVVLRCDCGTETQGNAGDALVCTRCGRRYETAGVMSQQLVEARVAAVHHKVMTRLGIGVLTTLALFRFGLTGFFVTFAVTALLWFGLVMRLVRQRSFARILTADSTQIRAEK
jgi:hypothetical protein